MKNNNGNKANKIIILSIIIIVFVVALVIFILNFTKDSSSFSILENNWINKNTNNIIDVSVYNDVPVYGINGEGVIFDYLDNFTESFGIKFNKVSYFANNPSNYKSVAFKILKSGEKVGNKDIIIYEDKYAVVGKADATINSLKDLANKKIGILSDDASLVNYYLSNIKNISYTPSADIDNLIKLVNEGDVEYIIVPKTMYLSSILSNNLHIVYHYPDLYRDYVLTVNDNTLYSIMRKYFMIYSKDKLNESYKNNLLNTVFDSLGITEEERLNYNSQEFVYGYVINMPFENTVSKQFVGTISNYLSGFEDLADVNFKVVAYSDIASLKKDLSFGNVDLVFANYATSGLNVDIINTSSLFSEDYVILSKDNININSIRSLYNKTVYTVNGTYLHNYLNVNSIATKAYNNTDELLRNIDDNSIVAMDKDTYVYYKDKKLADYKIVYEDNLDAEYRFAVRDVQKNRTFAKLFDYYVSSVDYKDIKYNYNTDFIVNTTSLLGNVIKYLLIALGIVILVIIGLVFSLKKKKSSKISKEDKYKFIDIMTSLKNRNYLNYNMKKWDDNVIYPQAILIIDLNNIKYINDNYGHEEGDNVIKKAASILIVNQKENSDVVRTDGNEFLIYMVGYDEKKVVEYIRKLNKELNELPHEFGATIGYSMITDDVKTIDDAINEATLAMREAKEKQK